MSDEKRFEELLDPWLTGELNADERREWEALLARNPELAEEARQEQALVAEIQTLRSAKAPESVRDTVKKELQMGAVIEVNKPRRHRPIFTMAAAAAIMIYAGITAVDRFFFQDSGESERQVEVARQIAELPEGAMEEVAARRRETPEFRQQIASARELAESSAGDVASAIPDPENLGAGRERAPLSERRMMAEANEAQKATPNLQEKPLKEAPSVFGASKAQRPGITLDMDPPAVDGPRSQATRNNEGGGLNFDMEDAAQVTTDESFQLKRDKALALTPRQFAVAMIGNAARLPNSAFEEGLRAKDSQLVMESTPEGLAARLRSLLTPDRDPGEEAANAFVAELIPALSPAIKGSEQPEENAALQSFFQSLHRFLNAEQGDHLQSMRESLVELYVPEEKRLSILQRVKALRPVE